MLFELKNAPDLFQRLMDQVLSGLQRIDMFVYLDNIIIYVFFLAEYQTKFNKFVEWLQHANLSYN